jgi:hypothetical protein
MGQHAKILQNDHNNDQRPKSGCDEVDNANYNQVRDAMATLKTTALIGARELQRLHDQRAEGVDPERKTQFPTHYAHDSRV